MILFIGFIYESYSDSQIPSRENVFFGPLLKSRILRVLPLILQYLSEDSLFCLRVLVAYIRYFKKLLEADDITGLGKHLLKMRRQQPGITDIYLVFLPEEFRCTQE